MSRLHPGGHGWSGRLPTPPELDSAPEMAILAVLPVLLDLALSALVVANPELTDSDPPYVHPPRVRCARAIVRRVARLENALSAYRRAIDRDAAHEHHDFTDDMPF